MAPPRRRRQPPLQAWESAVDPDAVPDPNAPPVFGQAARGQPRPINPAFERGPVLTEPGFGENSPGNTDVNGPGYTAADEVARWERRLKAVTMRNAGASYAKIGETLGISPQLAREDIRVALRELVSIPAEEMVTRQRAILLDITRANYMAAMGGDHDAQAMIIKALEHEARLFGLYAPTRVNVGISQDEFGRQAAELLAALDQMGIGPAPLRELAGVAQPGRTVPAPGPTVDEEGQPWSNL